MDGGLKQKKLQRLGAFESQVIGICEPAQLGSDLEIRADVGKKNPRIHEIGLALFFAGAQRRNQAARRSEQNARAKQANSFAIPKAEEPSREIGEIDNGIEPARAPVAGIAVTRRVKGRNAITHPVLVVRKLGGRHLGVHRHALPGNRIERVFAKRLIKSMGQINAANVAAAKPAEVAHANAVTNRPRSRILVDDVPNRRRADQEAVVVIVQARIVFVPRGDKFCRIAGKKEILQISVPKHHLLVAAVERVQAAVCVFLEEVKVGEVVLDAVTMQIAEDTQCGFFVNKQKTAKVRIELLNSRAGRNEIIIGSKVVEFDLDEGFLEAKILVESVGPAPYVWARELSNHSG